jgi:hypothetical protein
MMAEKYDFEFITLSLGLLPICGGKHAVNIGAIDALTRLDTGGWGLVLRHSTSYTPLTDDDMAELERTIKLRAEDARRIQKESFKQQMRAQAEAAQELSAGVAPGGVIVGGAPGKRFRQ